MAKVAKVTISPAGRSVREPPPAARAGGPLVEGRRSLSCYPQGTNDSHGQPAGEQVMAWACFRQRIEVANLDSSRFEPVEAIVDTGASFSMLPRPLLEGLGIKPHDRRRFDSVGGQVIEREIGAAWIRVDGRVAVSEIAFGQEDDPVLLGAHSLEGLALGVDPLGGRLVERELYLF